MSGGGGKYIQGENGRGAEYVHDVGIPGSIVYPQWY